MLHVESVKDLKGDGIRWFHILKSKFKVIMSSFYNDPQLQTTDFLNELLSQTRKVSLHLCAQGELAVWIHNTTSANN